MTDYIKFDRDKHDCPTHYLINYKIDGIQSTSIVDASYLDADNFHHNNNGGYSIVDLLVKID